MADDAGSVGIGLIVGIAVVAAIALVLLFASAPSILAAEKI
jgi:hypothetical protein